MDISRFRKILSAPWFALIIIALAAFVVYSNAYRCPFVFDDSHSIVKNVEIRDLSSFSSPGRFLKSRTAVDFTFALNYKFGKLDVFGYHLVNILIHIINGFIVYFLALALLGLLLRPSGAGGKAESAKLKGQRKEGKAQKKRGEGGKRKEADGISQSSILALQSSIPAIALFAALIFIVHPIQTQAVTYIVQRYASLAALFYMGSVLFYLKGRVIVQSSKLREQGAGGKAQSTEDKDQRNLLPSVFSLQPSTVSLQSSAFFILSIVCGLLAFMSKQNTASLPGAIILIECMCFGGTWRERARRFLWVIPVLILFAAFVLWAMGLFSGAGIGSMLEDASKLARETELVSRWSYLCTQFNVMVIYIRLLFLPIGQNLDYVYRFNTSFFNGLTPFAFAFLAGLVGLAIWKRKRYPVLTVAIFWFFITLSVESSIIPISDALFEHRLYLPLFSFALLVSWLPFRFFPKSRVLVILICVSIFISLGTATYLRNRIWQDEMILWTDVLAKSPQNSRACMSLGNALVSEGRYDEAIRCHSRVLKLRPEVAIANFNMGVALDRRGDKDEAIRYYMKALYINPDYAKAHVNIGNILKDRGDFEGAARHYTEALRLNPAHAEAHVNMGNILEMRGDFEGSARHYSEALVIKPGYANAYANLSRVLGQSGDSALAVRCYREVLRSNPENANVRMNLGIALSRMGNLNGAVEHFSEAVRINPKDARAHYNLGRALFKQGKIGNAAKQYSESIRIMPQNPNAHYSLALILHSLGDFPGAITHFEETMRLEPSLRAQASYNSARVYARQGKIEESVGWLKRAVDEGFNNWNRLKTDADLKDISDTSYYRSIIRDHR